MTKEQKIKEVYGDNFYLVKENIDNDGWFNNHCENYVHAYHSIIKNTELESKMHNDDYYYRPVLLKGIEDNNGWIKIESESDLPKNEDGFYFYQKSDWSIQAKPCTLKILKNVFNYLKESNAPLTHYKEIPLEIQKPPLY